MLKLIFSILISWGKLLNGKDEVCHPVDRLVKCDNQFWPVSSKFNSFIPMNEIAHIHQNKSTARPPNHSVQSFSKVHCLQQHQLQVPFVRQLSKEIGSLSIASHMLSVCTRHTTARWCCPATRRPNRCPKTCWNRSATSGTTARGCVASRAAACRCDTCAADHQENHCLSSGPLFIGRRHTL